MKIDGKKEAILLLQNLAPSEQKKLIMKMRVRDPEMADFLENNLVTFEDIQYLTAKMMQVFMREITLDKLGLALRVSSEELKNHIFNNISSRMKADIEDTLNGPPRKVSDVGTAQSEIVAILKSLVDRGEVVIDRSGAGEEYV